MSAVISALDEKQVELAQPYEQIKSFSVHL
jgi:hypothetical protein